MEDLRSLYDFVWESGLDMCGYHVNQELMRDFAEGGPRSQEMMAKILEKYPTLEDAKRAYDQS